MKSKFLAFLLSVVVAFGLWLYVITVVNPESEKTYYEIPVVLQNKEILTERGLMIVSETPKVTLALKGNRTTLNDLNEANINVITNVANIEKPGTHHLTYDISYPGNVSKYDISVLSSSTDLITIKVENKIKKTIPVKIDYGGTSVPEGFIADLQKAQLDRPNIEVSGPESVMQYIHQAVIKVDLTDKTKTIVGEYQYTLCNQESVPVNAAMVTTNVEKVNLIVKIQRLKEITLAVEIIDGGGATSQTSTVRINPQKIWVSGNDSLLEKLNVLTIGTINLGDILEDTTLTFDIVLPEGVTNQTGVEKATVEVKFPQLMTKTFAVTAFTAINVPEGLEGHISAQSLPVTVRGPIDMVKAMRETDLLVKVDFSDKQMGSIYRSANVTISKTFSKVGAVGTYQVLTELKELEVPDPTEETTTP